jgi:hypothetical protein
MMRRTLQTHLRTCYTQKDQFCEDWSIGLKIEQRSGDKVINIYSRLMIKSKVKELIKINKNWLTLLSWAGSSENLLRNIIFCLFLRHLQKIDFPNGSFHVNLTKRCHHGSGFSKLIFFVKSTFCSIIFYLKHFLFGLDDFELFDYFLAKKGQIYKRASKNVEN